MENEKFHLLPGRVYVKGFLRNYAGFLGLNPNTLVSAYEDKVPPAEREDDLQANKLTHAKEPGRRKILKVILALAAVALAAGLIYLPSLTEEKKAIPPRGQGGGVAGENKAGPQEKADQGKGKTQAGSEKQQGVWLILNVTDNQSWMRVEVDGKKAFEGLVPAGQIKEFKGNEKITLRLGNAGVVQVEFNGQKIGVLGGFGQVVTKEFNAPQG